MFMVFLFLPCGELDEQHSIIGLGCCLVSRAVTFDLAAFCAFMNDDITLFRVGHDLYGLHRSAAFAGSVTGIYVNVK